MAAYTFDPTVPANTETPRNGAQRIRNVVTAILTMLNLPTGTGAQTVAGPFISSFDSNGNPTFPSLSQVASDPTTATGLVTKQYADAKVPYVIATGGDAYVGTFSDIPALVTGQRVAVKIPIANTTTTPTFNLNTLGAVNIKMVDGSAPAIGALKASGIYEMVYDSGSNTWVLPGISNAQATLNIQAGTVAPASLTGMTNAQHAITFPSAYTSSVTSIVVSPIVTTATGSRSAIAYVENTTVTTSGFTLTLGNGANQTITIGAYWMSLGV